MILAKNIALIGLMGTGKSTLGFKLASVLSKSFLDSDALLESFAGQSVRAFFAERGELAFRELESKILQTTFEGNQDFVLGTGGGVVLEPANREFLRAKALVVWLHCDVEILASRLTGDDTRPLLAEGERLNKLLELTQARNPLYKLTAHHSLDTGALSEAEALGGLLDLVYNHSK